jgi:GT2 family glycosyltransferase
MKTLAVIINHNGKMYTNQLYRALKPYEDAGNYELVVLDNGTNRMEEFSEYTSYVSNENTYYGGAVNLIFNLMQESPQYDSVLILNNDIILHPYNFVKTLRSAMFDDGYMVVSPSVLQPEEDQCHWKQMHNWGSSVTREVRWVDFMCPLIHRTVVDSIKLYSPILKYGWGQDFYTGYVCGQNGWKVGVVDTSTIIHLSSLTYREARSNITASEYSDKATHGLHEFFASEGLTSEFHSLYHYGETYTWSTTQ